MKGVSLFSSDGEGRFRRHEIPDSARGDTHGMQVLWGIIDEGVKMRSKNLPSRHLGARWKMQAAEI